MNASHLTVLTGASRGMGLAMGLQLLREGHDLLTLSRQTSETLAATARDLGRACEQWPADLAEPGPVGARLAQWLAARGPAGLASVTLINNAGVIPAIAPLGDIPGEDIARALRVGLEAPMRLTSDFLRATASWPCVRKVLNISSGLGRRAMASQAAYCAAKAGLDNFTRCVAIEESLRPQGARLCALAPGVIDTDMQVHLRGADPARFPDQGGFAQLKAQGMLMSPEVAAAKVLAYLAREDFGANPVADVRQA